MANPAVIENGLLLDEMWRQIFEYLPVADRKNVRLACRKFYDVANCASLLKSEEIVFTGSLALASIGSLANSRRRIWNLKFVAVNLKADAGFLHFFRNQGAKVHSVTFDLCPVMVPELMRYMIVNCANLRSFAMNIDYDTGKRIPFDYVLDDFNSLCDDGIIRQHVSSFTLTVSYYYCKLTNAQFVNFFTVFPSIKELCFQFDNLPYEEQYERSSAVPPSGSQFSFSCLYLQLVGMRHQLEKLKLTLYLDDLENEIEFERWNKISLIEIENLKELSIRRIEFQDRDSLILLTPFLNFRHLTVFDCEIFTEILEEISGSDFLRNLLNAARELRSLKLRSYSHFPLTADCLLALVQSRLRILHLPRFKFILYNFQVYCSLPINCTLKCLKLPGMDEFCIILFTKFFRSLEKLVVDKVSGNILTNVFQYQTKLRHLTINVPSSVNSSAHEQWLNNPDRLSGQLGYLTTLHLIDIQSFELSKFFLIQFEFPKLQALSIIFSYKKVVIDFNDNLFWQSIQKFADLEYLDVQWGVAISPDQFSALCCSLTKLRYFIYFKNSMKPFGMQMFHTLFQRCPSVRLIVQGDPQSYSVKYFRDIGTNTVGHVLWPAEKNYSKSFIYEEIPRKYFPYKDYHMYSPDSRYQPASSDNAP